MYRPPMGGTFVAISVSESLQYGYMDNQETPQTLRFVRPSLFRVAPLTYMVCLGYGVVNTLIGFGLFHFFSPEKPIAVANIFSYQLWGWIFFLVGVTSIVFLIINDWKATRGLLLLGLAIKAIWAVALILRTFIAPETVVITLVWLFFAYIQAVTYIFFIPKLQVGYERKFS
jgi:uncharacterized membrane protein HdeD (DUF308 family)